MVGWHHQFNGHEFEQTLGDNERQGSLACCNSWDHIELNTTWRLNNNHGSFKTVAFTIEKIIYNWTLSFQTHVVGGPTVIFISINFLLFSIIHYDS